MKRSSRSIIALGLASSLFQVVQARAASLTTPLPTRQAYVKTVGVVPFHSIDGTVLDLNADLREMLAGSLDRGKLGAFEPTNLVDDAGNIIDKPAKDACGEWIQIEANITDFELKLNEFGITIGYSAGKDLNTAITDASGTVDVTVGLVSMDFVVRQCSGTTCTRVVDSLKTSQTVAGNVTLKVDFSQITTSATFLWKTGLGNLLQKMMDAGVADLEKSPHVNELDWNTQVQTVWTDKSGTHFTMDAGVKNRIAANQTFSVTYSNDQGGGACESFPIVSNYAHTVRVDQLTSEAIVDQAVSSHGIQPGDHVTVHVNAK